MAKVARPKELVHIMKRGGGWAIRIHGAKRASRLFESKEEAVKIATEKFKKIGHDLVIHRNDGTVEKWLYSKNCG